MVEEPLCGGATANSNLFILFYLFIYRNATDGREKNSTFWYFIRVPKNKIVTSDNYNVQNTEEQPPDITGMYRPIAFI